LDAIEKLLVVERFLEEVHRATLHRADAGVHVSVPGDEDDRNITLRLSQRRLEIETARAWQPNVEHEACGSIRGRLVEERLGRLEGFDLQADGPNQSREGSAHRRVVVDDIHDRRSNGALSPP